MREEVEKEKEEGTSPEAVRCWGGGVYSWSCCKTQQLKKKKKPNKTFWLHKFNLALYPQAVRCDWGNRVEDSRFDVSERISYTSLS